MNTNLSLTEYPLLEKAHVKNQGDSLNNEHLEDYPLLQKARVKSHPRKMKSGKIVQVREHTDIRTKKDKVTAIFDKQKRGEFSISHKFDVPSVRYKGIYYFPNNIKPSKVREGKPFEIQVIYSDGKWRQDTMYITEELKNKITAYYKTTDSKKDRNLSVADKHQIKIAKQTLKMPGAMAGVMGQSKEEARKVLAKFGVKKSILDKYPLLAKVIYPDMDKSIKFQIGDPKMKSTERPVLDSVKFPILAEAHANLKKSMSFKINGQKLKTAIDGKIATCKGELIVLEKEYPPVAVNSEDVSEKVAESDAPVTKKEVEVKVTAHWKVRQKKREIEELETYARNINVKISYNLDKYELSQFGL